MLYNECISNNYNNPVITN